jgi:hypothetical protein
VYVVCIVLNVSVAPHFSLFFFFFFAVIPCRPLPSARKHPSFSSSCSDDDDVDLKACACHHHDRRPPPPPICDSAVLLFGRLFHFLTYLSLPDQLLLLLFVALFCSQAFFLSFIPHFRRVVFVDLYSLTGSSSSSSSSYSIFLFFLVDLEVHSLCLSLFLFLGVGVL